MKRLTLAALLLIAAPAWAADRQPAPAPAPAAEAVAPAAKPETVLPPAMLLDPELARIAASIRHGLVAKGATSEELQAILPDLTLGAIMRFSDQDWRVWVNGLRYAPGDRAADFEIVKVTDQFVEFSLAKGAKRVRLMPNQSFRAVYGDVVEGTP